MRYASLTFALILAVGTAPVAGTELQRVFFNDGRSIDVVAITFEDGQAILTMPGGDLIAFAARRVARVEPVEPVEPDEPVDADRDIPSDTLSANSGNGIPGVDMSGPGRIEPRSGESMGDEPAREGAPAAASGQEGPPVAGEDEGPGAPAGGRYARRAAPVEIEAIIQETASKYGLHVDLLKAVIAVESGYRVDAVSPKGAQGLMQLMPGTARELSVTDPFDPRQNIDAGARYLRQLLDAHDNQYWKALAAYNAGAGRVARYDGIPPYQETIQYIRRVLELYDSPRPIPTHGDPTGN